MTAIPTLILYDSLDARVHDDEYVRRDLLYTEYATIRLDGNTENISARKFETKAADNGTSGSKDPAGAVRKGIEYEISAVRIRDHLFIKISSKFGTTETTIALYDSTRYAYIGITGENCVISNIDIKESEEAVSPDSYTRIAEEITYIDGPEGDMPNVQIDGWRSNASEALPVTGDMRIRFHSISLPTARLVWHCPFVSLFYSKNGKTDGEGFADYAVVRLDGEDWDSNDYANNMNVVVKNDEFGNWDKWKERNRAGLDWDVMITRKGNAVTVSTENAGISIRFTSEVKTDPPEIYMALTGDQVAITNIRIEKLNSTES